MKRSKIKLQGNEPAIFLRYDEENDTTTFKCYKCSHIDYCEGNPTNSDVNCKNGLIIYNHDQWAALTKVEKQKKRRIAEDIVPFIVSFLSFLFFKFARDYLRDDINSIDIADFIIFTIIGGFCFRVAYAVLKHNWR